MIFEDDNILRVTLVQADILWEQAGANLEAYRRALEGLEGQTDLAVLPEVCANGFGSNPEKVAQPNDGETIRFLQRLACEKNLAITGSFMAREDVPAGEGSLKTRYFNRGFFLYPDGRRVFFDKCHLFRMGNEGAVYTAGSPEPCIVSYRGWNIRLIICYDLRFPVFCRNRVTDDPLRHYEYDLMTVVANWPEARIQSWTNLLEARATENQAYVVGVNRVGDDAMDLHYNGMSAAYSNIGRLMSHLEPDRPGVETVRLSQQKLFHQRERFPSWADADTFEIL